jgi:flavin-dependent dehydrogenase
LTLGADVLIVGAGPAGIATAIAASQKGLHAILVDARKPPIDKACGEGLLPEAVASLSRIGIDLYPPNAIPFSGIRFTDQESTASATFPKGCAFGLRRTRLHRLLVERAERAFRASKPAACRPIKDLFRRAGSWARMGCGPASESSPS